MHQNVGRTLSVRMDYSAPSDPLTELKGEWSVEWRERGERMMKDPQCHSECALTPLPVDALKYVADAAVRATACD